MNGGVGQFARVLDATIAESMARLSRQHLPAPDCGTECPCPSMCGEFGCADDALADSANGGAEDPYSAENLS